MERKLGNTNPSGKAIDLLVKRKIEAVEPTPPPIEGWTRSKTWQVIKSKLEGSNKTIIAWGFSIAASVSMLVGAEWAWTDVNIFEDETEKVESPLASKPDFELEKENPEIGISITEDRELIVLDNVQIKRPSLLNPSPANTLPIRLTKFNTKSKREVYQRNHKRDPLIRPFIYMGHSLILGATPGLGIDVKLKSFRRNAARHEINLGLQANFQQIVNEEKNQTYPFTYLHLGYSRTNDNNDKGWAAQAGVMINPDSNVYQQKTVKFSLNRQFNRHIKAGPEFIFTNNFRKVYPGISIILS